MVIRQINMLNERVTQIEVYVNSTNTWWQEVDEEKIHTTKLKRFYFTLTVE